jgi:hypothetical protein
MNLFSSGSFLIFASATSSLVAGIEQLINQICFATNLLAGGGASLLEGTHELGKP